VQAVSVNNAPVASAGIDQTVGEGELVFLDGSGSSDPDGDELSYQWTQTGGILVSLSDATVVNPSFTAPSSITQDEVLTFEIVVSDGEFSSMPDAVNVTVQAVQANYINIAPFATVTASSETQWSNQLAAKAVDMVIDGWPGDFSREWATTGEGSGAWIRLTWPIAYSVDQVILYDRPNLNDYIAKAMSKTKPSFALILQHEIHQIFRFD